MTNALLDLWRGQPAHGSILGELWLNGTFCCYTLECLAVAIPAGAYQVQLTTCSRQRKLLPQLLGSGVRAADQVRLYPGATTPAPRPGLLVGLAHLPSGTTIYRSEEAFVALMNRLLPATTIRLTIH